MYNFLEFSMTVDFEVMPFYKSDYDIIIMTLIIDVQERSDQKTPVVENFGTPNQLRPRPLCALHTTTTFTVFWMKFWEFCRLRTGFSLI